MSGQPEQLALELREVTKRIGRRTIVDRISFGVPCGKVFGFLGPNGAGKTTTIRMIVGLMSVTAGEILINGISVSREFERAIRHVGAIVENPEMYKFLSGYHNLVHYARMAGGVGRDRIDEVVRLVGLEQRIHDKVKTYSLGMRQRLGVAQALLHRPSLLILDEPTDSLDPAGIRELRDYLRRLAREEGISVFVSSHLLSEMELMCDRVAIIQGGRLVDVRRLKDIVRPAGECGVVVFDVDDPARALEVIRAFDAEADAEVRPDGLAVELDRARIPAINARLVAAGVNVYGIRSEMRTLEDRFLELTGREAVD